MTLERKIDLTFSKSLDETVPLTMEERIYWSDHNIFVFIEFNTHVKNFHFNERWDKRIAELNKGWDSRLVVK